MTPSHSLEYLTDYYIENGYLVFTEKYLKSRGYCCGSGCRHCPYGKNEELKDIGTHNNQSNSKK